MSKNEKGIHNKSEDNVIEFPKPPAPSDSGGEEDVGDESPTRFYFVPDWDSGDDDSAA